MTFHGLFIGINRYKSPFVSNLTCSKRDATGLYALFADTFGEQNCKLLTDEWATSTAIQDEFASRLSETKSADLVVIAFSGHGSDCHRLVTHDCDPNNLDGTTIRLDDLTALFAKIPARNVILILDCCFAGGAGSKVFHEEIAAKGMSSTEDILAHVAGSGRIVLTASKPDQEAYEDRRQRYSFFTFHLIEGLRGAPEIVKDGRISVLALMNFVTKRVIESTNQVRVTQEPGIRGKIDGDFSFPVLNFGPIYERLFPEMPTKRIGLDVNELKAFGFPSRLIDIWRGSIGSLNSLQQNAINDYGLFEGNNIIVSAPTSSGKTMIGELAALYAFSRGERSYFLLPLRALVNDKYEDFTRKYSEYGVRVIRSTGEISDDKDALARGKFDIALLTYEKFAATVLGSPHILRQAGLVVIDEIQTVTDRNRGANLEFLLTMLRSQRVLGIEPQLIALSAVIGDTNGLENWLGARLLRSDKRPVPLDEGILDFAGTFKVLTPDFKEVITDNYVVPEFRKGSSQDIIIPLVRKLVAGGEKVIVFRETKPIARATAKYLAGSLGFSPSKIPTLPDGDPSAASRLLKECLRGGVAFHNADLDREEKRILEESFRDPESELRVLVSTTTLAMGINTPAWSVVIAGLEHPDGPYSVAEYKNMVGRAGRLGFTERGKSFLIVGSYAEADKFWNNYVQKQPEDVESQFGGQNLLSIVCRILATAAASRIPAMCTNDILTFIDNSFAAHQMKFQSGNSLWPQQEIIGALHELKSHRLADETPQGYHLTELGKVAGEAGVEVRSILNLVEGLQQVSAEEITTSALIAAAQLTEELNDVLFPVHKKSHKERERWQFALNSQRISPQILSSLRRTAEDDAHFTIRAKRIAAALMWIQGIDLMAIEESVLQHLPGENAAGPIRAVAERTRDLIPVVGRVAEILTGQNYATIVEPVILRLEIGIASPIVSLARILGRSIGRAEYLALARANLISLEQIKAASDEDILKCVGTASKLQLLRAAATEPETIDLKRPNETEFVMPQVEG